MASVGAMACAMVLNRFPVCTNVKIAKAKVGLSEEANSSLDVHNLPFDLVPIAIGRMLDGVLKSIADRLLNGAALTSVLLDTGVSINKATANACDVINMKECEAMGITNALATDKLDVLSSLFTVGDL